MEIHVTGLYFNPATLERKLVTVEGDGNDPYYRLLNCRRIDFINLDDTTDLMVDDEGMFPSWGDPYITIISFKGTDVKIFGAFLLVNIDITEGETRSLDLFKIDEFKIRYSSRVSEFKSTGKVHDTPDHPVYVVQILDTELGKDKLVSQFKFSNYSPFELLGKMQSNRFSTSVGRFEYQFLLVINNHGHRIHSVYSDSPNDFFSSE